MRKLLLVFLFLPAAAVMVTAQTTDKAKLEQEKKALQEEIKQTQALYDKVKVQTKQSIGQLSILNKKINLQEQYIGSINKELQSIDDDIYKSNLEIYRLQKQEDTLKAQYARTVVNTYKNRSNYDYLNFIFSASSFNDAVRRVNYLRSFRAYRERQVSTILETQSLIAKRKEQQLGRKEQKNVALNDQTKQMSELESQKKEKAAVVAGLKSQEKDLQKQLAAKKSRDKQLQGSINAIVKKEIENARREAEARAKAERDKANSIADLKPSTGTKPANNGAATNPVKPSVNPAADNKTTSAPAVKPTVTFNSAADLSLSASFEGNRGTLPWPVDNGFVKIHFGKYDIEGTKLVGDNPGLTIGTQAGTPVKAVFNGEVVGVFNLGDGMAVTIKHGRYFTTYSNLSGVSVTKGSAVKTGQAIGRAGKDDDGSAGEIDFILMVETKNVNPETWLHR